MRAAKLSIRSLCLCASVFLPFRASASVKAGGYLKNFWQYSHSAFDGRDYNLDTFRARLSLEGDRGPLKAHLDFDQQVAAGSFFRTTEFRAFGYAPPKPWLDMERTISTGTTNGYGVGAYRAWIGVEDEDRVLRAGRQRIAWGTGKLWNPTDVLNPYDPTTVERDERRGVDALYARVGVGELGQAELAWAPNDTWIDHALLARVRGNWSGFDASLLAGKVQGSTASVMAGADFAGTLLDGTVHGEAAFFRPEYRARYWKAGLGYDYTFTSFGDASLITEYYHSGSGETDPARYDFASLRAGREPGVAQNDFGTVLSRDLHTLVKLECAAIVNADDGSTLAYPSLSWNAAPDLWLTAAWRRFGGEKLTEYGRQPNQAVLTAQYWF